MKKIIIIIILIIIGYQTIKIALANSYDIWTDMISAGGGAENTVSGDYQMLSTLGDSLLGQLEGTDYSVLGGFAALDQPDVVSFNIDAKSIDFGQLTPDHTAYATHSLRAYTNYQSGYNIYLASDPPVNEFGHYFSTIGSTPVSSQIGTEQFALNLVSNTSPNIGANPSGGTGWAAVNYNQTNKFAYNKGDVIASAATSSEETVYTVSIIMNMASSTIAGHYAVILDYSLVTNF